MDLDTFAQFLFGLIGTLTALVGLYFTYKYRQSMPKAPKFSCNWFANIWTEIFPQLCPQHSLDLPLYHSSPADRSGHQVQHRRVLYLFEEATQLLSHPTTLGSIPMIDHPHHRYTNT